MNREPSGRRCFRPQPVAVEDNGGESGEGESELKCGAQTLGAKGQQDYAGYLSVVVNETGSFVGSANVPRFKFTASSALVTIFS